jgi:acetyl-CoA carboxylase biotin carboxyl carrier protein
VSDDHSVRSPIPGIFYRRPDPNSDPFITEGDVIEEGAVVGLVEVMKQFHELRADAAGEVVEILVENEGTVDAGQPVVVLR